MVTNLILAYIYIYIYIYIFHFVSVQNILVALKKIKEKKKRTKKVVEEDIYWFLPYKTKQGKIGSNQLGISSNVRF